MTSNFGLTLEVLLGDKLAETALSIGTIEPLYILLWRRPEVRNLRAALTAGSVTETQIALFVEHLLSKFRKDIRFMGDVPLCAIAVALDDRQTEYAHSFLEKLSSLNVRELPLSRRIARIASDRRARRLGGLTVAEYSVASPAVMVPAFDEVHPRAVGATTDRRPRERVT